MALLIRELPLLLDENEGLIPVKIADRLGIDVGQIDSWKIVRKGIDARKKQNILRVYTVEFDCVGELDVLARNAHVKTLAPAVPSSPVIIPALPSAGHVIIAGMGPAGLFAALTLAEAGCCVTLIERGKPVKERLQDVRSFWDGDGLNPESNIQFGEGGAGTFSDGKLTSRMNNPLIQAVLKRLVEFGAPEEILWQAKPHIGSDRLRKILLLFRQHLLRLGVVIRFSTRLTGFEMNQGKVSGAVVDGDEVLPCDRLILATGHSARDTYTMLKDTGVTLEQKSFAIGLRVEHPLELINQIQYGIEGHPNLPAADYRLAWNNPKTGRGVYSFCMCPGGMVVNASSEQGRLVVNGMSEFKRDHPYSNSALVVTVTPADFASSDVYAGVEFQHRWEEAAFAAGGGSWRAPAQSVTGFLYGKGALSATSCRPGVTPADLQTCLPAFVAAEIRHALPHFDRKMHGFISQEATLIGVETRTSAPLRIVRAHTGESVSTPGLYPAGEGAGYAGGIMSAAVDGIKSAISIIHSFS